MHIAKNNMESVTVKTRQTICDGFAIPWPNISLGTLPALWPSASHAHAAGWLRQSFTCRPTYISMGPIRLSSSLCLGTRTGWLRAGRIENASTLAKRVRAAFTRQN